MMKRIFAGFVVLLSCSVASQAMAGNIAAGKALVEKYNCASCHGADYSSPTDPSYPKLGGQHEDYLAHALVGYKRGNGTNGRTNAIMAGQVKPLSGKDIKDIAAYLHSLPGSLVVK